MKKHQPIKRFVSALALAAFALLALAGCELFGLGKDPIEDPITDSITDPAEDPIIGVWDVVVSCDGGVRSHVSELDLPEGFSWTLEFNESGYVETYTNPEDDPVISVYSGTWLLVEDTYSLLSTGGWTSIAWFVGGALRMASEVSEEDYYELAKR
ncbi:MAG TPA: hypothetical protein PKW82_10055 [Spirochaetales bacterium]|nr:hypothetical protein [Spirochaetales bacterium]